MTWRVTTYLGQVTVAVDGEHATLTSDHYPGLRAVVSPVGALFRVRCSDGSASRHEAFTDALAAARAWVAQTSGAIWKADRSGQQRYAMGHGLCPHLSAAGMCGRTAEHGSVSCEVHR